MIVKIINKLKTGIVLLLYSQLNIGWKIKNNGGQIFFFFSFFFSLIIERDISMKIDFENVSSILNFDIYVPKSISQ